MAPPTVVVPQDHIVHSAQTRLERRLILPYFLHLRLQKPDHLQWIARHRLVKEGGGGGGWGEGGKTKLKTPENVKQ